MPRSRFNELAALAEENDGLVTAEQARAEGFTDSVLARLVQRRRIERISRGVYRIPYFSPGQFSQYREAVLWAKANRGPDLVAISHATALAVYGISDANPASIHLTVHSDARLRRKTPKGLVVHHGDLCTGDIALHEGIPVTTIERTTADVSGGIKGSHFRRVRGGASWASGVAEAHFRARRWKRIKQPQSGFIPCRMSVSG